MELHFTPNTFSTKLHFYEKQSAVFLDLYTLTHKKKALIVLDSGLKKAWEHKFLSMGIPKEQLLLLPAGEEVKTWSTVKDIITFLVERNRDRHSPLVVVGGGAACDVAALAASLYRRGCPLFLLPTTLVGMVDASIGGKTAINMESQGNMLKNVLGSFYPAQEVWYWPGWLTSLPHKERLSGLGELLKILWLKGKQGNLSHWRNWVLGEELTPFQWKEIILGIQTKIEIVEKDPLDTNGKRSTLNYGHTLGHAFESFAKGQTTHGEAIAWGMWAESSFLCGNAPFTQQIQKSLETVGMPPPHYLKGMEAGQIAALLLADKKIKTGKIHMHVLRNMGHIEPIQANPHELASFASQWIRDQLPTKKYSEKKYS